jgi:hypothetical protein
MTKKMCTFFMTAPFTTEEKFYYFEFIKRKMLEHLQRKLVATLIKFCFAFLD